MLADSPFLRACRGLPTSRTPAWMMRQAGRSLPEYRALRAEHGFQEMITRPELAAEVTLQPVRRHGVDAAVLFSDLITPVQAIVDGVSVETGKGPVIERPFRTKDDVQRLRPLDATKDLPYVIEAVQRCADVLTPLGVPVIGFAGAPFTVATYLIEGGKSKEFAATKRLMYAEPDTFAALLDALAGITIATLRAQVLAGASAVQVFDSWAGILSAADYATYSLPASTKVFAALADLGVPRIHFGVGTGELLGLMAAAGADVVGVDWRVDLGDARLRVGPRPGLQGNLDPVVCLAPWPVVEAKVRGIVDAGRAACPAAAPGGTTTGGYVFNLGHGVLPETDATVLTQIVDLVHRI